mmetsp:Transcript_29825/g.71023  ORF Transcript_29825/g.71023 Transcript_29825/m.71023 type:complete len:207 (+) Transcript_29825:1399-2019(+)
MHHRDQAFADFLFNLAVAASKQRPKAVSVCCKKPQVGFISFADERGHRRNRGGTWQLEEVHEFAIQIRSPLRLDNVDHTPQNSIDLKQCLQRLQDFALHLLRVDEDVLKLAQDGHERRRQRKAAFCFRRLQCGELFLKVLRNICDVLHQLSAVSAIHASLVPFSSGLRRSATTNRPQREASCFSHAVHLLALWVVAALVVQQSHCL